MDDSLIMMSVGFIASVIGIGTLVWRVGLRRGEEKQQNFAEKKKQKERDVQADAAFILLKKSEDIHDHPNEHGIGTNLIASQIELVIVNLKKDHKETTLRIETALNRFSTELKVTNDHTITLMDQNQTLLNHLINGA